MADALVLDTMPALTVHQPWAWAMARGIKPTENRSWATAYRGRMAIHAGTKWDETEVHALREVVQRARAQGSPLPRTLAEDLPYSGTGLVIATVVITGVCSASRHESTLVCDCPWAIAGLHHWQLTDARPLAEPVSARGRQKLWAWTPPAGCSWLSA